MKRLTLLIMFFIMSGCLSKPVQGPVTRTQHDAGYNYLKDVPQNMR